MYIGGLATAAFSVLCVVHPCSTPPNLGMENHDVSICARPDFGYKRSHLKFVLGSFLVRVEVCWKADVFRGSRRVIGHQSCVISLFFAGVETRPDSTTSPQLCTLRSPTKGGRIVSYVLFPPTCKRKNVGILLYVVNYQVLTCS